MSLEALLWREVGRHLELDASVQRIAPVLGRHVPVDLVIVRRVEREPTRLVTVALGECRERKGPRPAAARTEPGANETRALDAWLRQGRVVELDTRRPSALARALVPAGIEGTLLAGPLTAHGRAIGAALLVSHDTQGFSEDSQRDAAALLEPLSVAFENDQRLNELARMREALEADREALLSRLQRQDISEVVIGESGGLRSVMERVAQVARTDAPVLILGDTGSGKEVIARAIHARSRRAKGPVVRVNCGAIPGELVDSELFGHERGSFTGAVGMRRGWFERADGGTLFLDEIGELPLAAQVRLLRVLQDGTLERVGGHQPISVDVRIVAATHRYLEGMVAEGTFREDLWYRISVFPIRLPSLAERQEDIPALAAHFAHRAGLRLGGASLVPTERDVELLRRYAWPGNVRELAAVIERAAILGNGKRLEVRAALGSSTGDGVGSGAAGSAPSARPSSPPPRPAEIARVPSERLGTLAEAMTSHIERALVATRGRIEGRRGAARLLGINPHTLRARMRKLRIDWSRFRPALEEEDDDAPSDDRSGAPLG